MQPNQFNSIDPRKPEINARQLNRSAQIAQGLMLSGGENSITGITGTHSRRTNPARLNWYKVATQVGGGVYTAARQIWTVSTKAFVNETDTVNVAAYEVDNDDTVDVGDFFRAIEEYDFAGGTVVLFRKQSPAGSGGETNIEFGVPTADVEASAYTVALTVTDEKGVPTSGTVTLFPANDRKTQLLADRVWKKKVTGTMVGQPVYGAPKSTVTANAIFTEVMVGQWLKFTDSGVSYRIQGYTDSTHIDITGNASGELNNDTITVSGDILSFIRFPTAVGGVDGVLIGENRHMTPFPAILQHEDSGKGGEYDEWAEVEPNGAGAWTTKTDGRDHLNTGKSLWEINGVEGITAAVGTGDVVMVHIDYGSATQFSFSAPSFTVVGDNIWIEVDEAVNPYAINHIGPNTAVDGFYFQMILQHEGNTGSYFNGSIKDNPGGSCVGVRFDIKGHLFAFSIDAGSNWKNWPTGAADWPSGS